MKPRIEMSIEERMGDTSSCPKESGRTMTPTNIETNALMPSSIEPFGQGKCVEQTKLQSLLKETITLQLEIELQIKVCQATCMTL